jgi:hypothetical protein
VGGEESAEGEELLWVVKRRIAEHQEWRSKGLLGKPLRGRGEPSLISSSLRLSNRAR